MTLLDSLATWQLIAVFAASAGVVVAAGIVLARNGDLIAIRTGVGGLFVGMLLMTAATSLPEIVTDISAAASGAPDLAIGDLFGSSMANIAILAFVDLLHRGRVLPSTGLGHVVVSHSPGVLPRPGAASFGSRQALRCVIGMDGSEGAHTAVAHLPRLPTGEVLPVRPLEANALDAKVAEAAQRAERPAPRQRHLIGEGAPGASSSSTRDAFAQI